MKLWKFNKDPDHFHENEARKSYFTINGRMGETSYDWEDFNIKCGETLWSKKGTYLVSTFMISPKTDDGENIDYTVSKLVIYSHKQNQIIQMIRETEKAFGFKIEQVQWL